MIYARYEDEDGDVIEVQTLAEGLISITVMPNGEEDEGVIVNIPADKMQRLLNLVTE